MSVEFAAFKAGANLSRSMARPPIENERQKTARECLAARKSRGGRPWSCIARATSIPATTDRVPHGADTRADGPSLDGPPTLAGCLPVNAAEAEITGAGLEWTVSMISASAGL